MTLLLATDSAQMTAPTLRGKAAWPKEAPLILGTSRILVALLIGLALALRLTTSQLHWTTGLNRVHLQRGSISTLATTVGEHRPMMIFIAAIVELLVAT